MVKFEIKNSTLVFDCKNWIIPPSIEDSAAAMGVVVDTLRRVRGIEKIVFLEVREREYDVEQTSMLKEIARVYDELERMVHRRLLRTKPQILSIIELLKYDPIAAYVKLNHLIRYTEKVDPTFAKATLLPIKKFFDSLTLIQKAKHLLPKYRLGDRNIYRRIFNPIIKPLFLPTKIIITVPKDSELIESYLVLNIPVKIFKLKNKVRNLYYMTPPEIILGAEKSSVLEEAKTRLGEYRPTGEALKDIEKTRATFLTICRNIIREIVTRRNLRYSHSEIEELAEILLRYTVGFGILELLLADEKIQDIYINSPIGTLPIFINHADYGECETNLIPTPEEAESWATRFRLYSGRPLDESNPVLDTELYTPFGRARVTVITRTLSPEGLGFALRRHRDRPWTFPLFIKHKFFNPLFAGLMSFIIDGGRSVLVAGGRGSGKTSLLNAMMLEIMRKYRIIVLEDTLELSVPLMRTLGYNIERLKSRSIITRIETELPAEEALRTALRLGDSVLIIGEVRSAEALALFEAMRIGAMAHLVAGTIHGESPYGVYDRVVHDLGVKPTSFKAVDLIVISNILTTPDGLRRFRRVIEVTEVRKKWKEDPLDEGGFIPLMQYSAKEDSLKPTDTLLEGESEVLMEIAKRVREWRGAWDRVWENILLRAKVKETLVDISSKLKRPELLEAPFVVESNDMFHSISEKVAEEVGFVDSKLVYERWFNWLRKRIK